MGRELLLGNNQMSRLLLVAGVRDYKSYIYIYISRIDISRFVVQKLELRDESSHQNAHFFLDPTYVRGSRELKSIS